MIADLGDALDLGELVKRAVKYLVEGFMVAIAAYAIPKRSLNFDEVALISLTAAAGQTSYPKNSNLVRRLLEKVFRLSLNGKKRCNKGAKTYTLRLLL